MNLKADRATIVVACSLGLIAVLVFYWIMHFWLLRQGFVAEIDNIQPRTSRLLGMVATVQELEAASGSASTLLRELAYSAERDSATTAAAMQQDIRELLTEAGLSVSGSQILQRRKADEFDRLSLDVTAEGNTDALEEALSKLDQMRPLVFIKSISIKPSRASRTRSRSRQGAIPEAGDPRKVTARFNLFSLRLKN